MARYDAIAEASLAVLRLLEDAYPTDLVVDSEGVGVDVQFPLLRGADFPASASTALSLFVYRIQVDGHRSLHSRRGLEENHTRPQLGIELHFLLTAWAESAAMQHVLLGWAMRVLADHPILPASVLDSSAAGVFHQDEALQLRQADLASEEIVRLWDRLGDRYELSVPYVLAGLQLDSEREVGGGLVTETHLRHGEAIS